MSHPTVTVSIRQALQTGQRRAAELERTQQLELGDDLYIRIAPGGRRFLLFGLAEEPSESVARAIAEVLGLQRPQYGWYQGATLRSLTVVEDGEELPQSPTHTEAAADTTAAAPGPDAAEPRPQ